MKITNSIIQMYSSHEKIEREKEEERLQMWIGNRRPGFERAASPGGQTQQVMADTLELSEKGKKMQAQQNTVVDLCEVEEEGEIDIDDVTKLKALLLEKLLHAITGKKIKIQIPEKIKMRKAVPVPQVPEGASVQQQQRHGWGIEYDYQKSYYEKEKMSFQSTGIVCTADGRKIEFSVQLNMDREFASHQRLSFRAGDAVTIDPLVVHYGTNLPELTQQKFSFDLDCDGTLDSISFVGKGSGFLAIDRNGDGKVNDGSELFGPATDDGFAELRQWDEDGNGWIDENDAIYEKLRIWTKDEQGNDRLFALGQKGIGAIYLGRVDTAFDMKDTSNQLHGEIKQSGIFLRENGSAGVVQEIDLAI